MPEYRQTLPYTLPERVTTGPDGLPLKDGPGKAPRPESNAIADWLAGMFWRTPRQDPRMISNVFMGNEDPEVDRVASRVGFASRRELPAPPPPEIQSQMANRGRQRVFNEAGENRFGAGWPAVQSFHQTPEMRREIEVDAGLRPGASTPLSREQRALLNVISNFEGTDLYPNSGYNTMVGGEQVEDLSRHPQRVGVRTVEGDSTAFGRYQFTGGTGPGREGTWQRAARALGLSDMSPESQDRAAWWLADETYRGSTGRSLQDDINVPERWPAIAAALGQHWASFPGRLGSRHGQQRGVQDFTLALRNQLESAAEAQPRDAAEFIGLNQFRRQPQRFISSDRDEPIGRGGY